MLQIGLIVGSTRSGRFADKPVEWLVRIGAKRQDLKLQVLDLRDFPLPFFDELASPSAVPPKHPVAQRWAAALAACDGFVVVTPEYNHAMPAVLKNALDYAHKEYACKPAVFVGYGSLGATRSVLALRTVMATLRMAPLAKAVHVAGADLAALRAGGSFDGMPHLETSANAMFDELVLWGRALKTMR